MTVSTVNYSVINKSDRASTPSETHAPSANRSWCCSLSHARWYFIYLLNRL